MRSKPFIKILSAGLTVAIFTQCAFAYRPETSLWAERKKTVQVASLSQFPAASVRVQSPVSSARRFPQSSKSSALDDVLAHLPNQTGSLRNVFLPENPTGAAVVFIQDVHANQEAQENIGKTIKALVASKKIDRIALEGAFDSIDLSRFRSFPSQIPVQKTADYLLLKNEISGPVHAALISSVPFPPILGIDDQIHYQANVAAYKESFPLIEKAKAGLARDLDKLNHQKELIFNPPLLEFEKVVASYREQQITIGAFAQELAKNSQNIPDELRKFLKAYDLERSLDFQQVEIERARLINTLLSRLTPARAGELTGRTLDYRLGKLSRSDFYAYLKDLCRDNGVDFSAVPSMARYIDYVLIAGQLNAEKLMGELSGVEKRHFESLAATAEEKKLIAELKRAYLIGKLVRFELTKEEWKSYKEVSHPAYAPFERFYAEAEIRDQKIAENLLSHGKGISILVAGGFHSPGITNRLLEKGVTVVSLVPRISKVDSLNGSAYLSAFAQEKTPLEKLFRGEKLFLASNPGGDPLKALLIAVSAAAKKGLARDFKPASPDDILRRAGFRAPVVKSASHSDNGNSSRLRINGVTLSTTYKPRADGGLDIEDVEVGGSGRGELSLFRGWTYRKWAPGLLESGAPLFLLITSLGFLGMPWNLWLFALAVPAVLFLTPLGPGRFVVLTHEFFRSLEDYRITKRWAWKKLSETEADEKKKAAFQLKKVFASSFIFSLLIFGFHPGLALITAAIVLIGAHYTNDWAYQFEENALNAALNAIHDQDFGPVRHLAGFKSIATHGPTSSVIVTSDELFEIEFHRFMGGLDITVFINGKQTDLSTYEYPDKTGLLFPADYVHVLYDSMEKIVTVIPFDVKGQEIPGKTFSFDSATEKAVVSFKDAVHWMHHVHKILSSHSPPPADSSDSETSQSAPANLTAAPPSADTTIKKILPSIEPPFYLRILSLVFFVLSGGSARMGEGELSFRSFGIGNLKPEYEDDYGSRTLFENFQLPILRFLARGTAEQPAPTLLDVQRVGMTEANFTLEILESILRLIDKQKGREKLNYPVELAYKRAQRILEEKKRTPASKALTIENLQFQNPRTREILAKAMNKANRPAFGLAEIQKILRTTSPFFTRREVIKLVAEIKEEINRRPITDALEEGLDHLEKLSRQSVALKLWEVYLLASDPAIKKWLKSVEKKVPINRKLIAEQNSIDPSDHQRISLLIREMKWILFKQIGKDTLDPEAEGVFLELNHLAHVRDFPYSRTIARKGILRSLLLGWVQNRLTSGQILGTVRNITENGRIARVSMGSSAIEITPGNAEIGIADLESALSVSSSLSPFTIERSERDGLVYVDVEPAPRVLFTSGVALFFGLIFELFRSTAYDSSRFSNFTVSHISWWMDPLLTGGASFIFYATYGYSLYGLWPFVATFLFGLSFFLFIHLWHGLRKYGDYEAIFFFSELTPERAAPVDIAVAGAVKTLMYAWFVLRHYSLLLIAIPLGYKLGLMAGLLVGILGFAIAAFGHLKENQVLKSKWELFRSITLHAVFLLLLVNVILSQWNLPSKTTGERASPPSIEKEKTLSLKTSGNDRFAQDFYEKSHLPYGEIKELISQWSREIGFSQEKRRHREIALRIGFLYKNLNEKEKHELSAVIRSRGLHDNFNIWDEKDWSIIEEFLLINPKKPMRYFFLLTRQKFGDSKNADNRKTALAFCREVEKLGLGAALEGEASNAQNDPLIDISKEKDRVFFLKLAALAKGDTLAVLRLLHSGISNRKYELATDKDREKILGNLKRFWPHLPKDGGERLKILSVIPSDYDLSDDAHLNLLIQTAPLGENAVQFATSQSSKKKVDPTTISDFIAKIGDRAGAWPAIKRVFQFELDFNREADRAFVIQLIGAVAPFDSAGPAVYSLIHLNLEGDISDRENRQSILEFFTKVSAFHGKESGAVFDVYKAISERKIRLGELRHHNRAVALREAFFKEKNEERKLRLWMDWKSLSPIFSPGINDLLRILKTESPRIKLAVLNSMETPIRQLRVSEKQSGAFADLVLSEKDEAVRRRLVAEWVRVALLGDAEAFPVPLRSVLKRLPHLSALLFKGDPAVSRDLHALALTGLTIHPKMDFYANFLRLWAESLNQLKRNGSVSYDENLKEFRSAQTRAITFLTSKKFTQFTLWTIDGNGGVLGNPAEVQPPVEQVKAAWAAASANHEKVLDELNRQKALTKRGFIALMFFIATLIMLMNRSLLGILIRWSARWAESFLWRFLLPAFSVDTIENTNNHLKEIARHMAFQIALTAGGRRLLFAYPGEFSALIREIGKNSDLKDTLKGDGVVRNVRLFVTGKTARDLFQLAVLIGPQYGPSLLDVYMQLVNYQVNNQPQSMIEAGFPKFLEFWLTLSRQIRSGPVLTGPEEFTRKNEWALVFTSLLQRLRKGDPAATRLIASAIYDDAYTRRPLVERFKQMSAPDGAKGWDGASTINGRPHRNRGFDLDPFSALPQPNATADDLRALSIVAQIAATWYNVHYEPRASDHDFFLKLLGDPESKDLWPLAVAVFVEVFNAHSGSVLFSMDQLAALLSIRESMRLRNSGFADGVPEKLRAIIHTSLSRMEQGGDQLKPLAWKWLERLMDIFNDELRARQRKRSRHVGLPVPLELAPSTNLHWTFPSDVEFMRELFGILIRAIEPSISPVSASRLFDRALAQMDAPLPDSSGSEWAFFLISIGLPQINSKLKPHGRLGLAPGHFLFAVPSTWGIWNLWYSSKEAVEKISTSRETAFLVAGFLAIGLFFIFRFTLPILLNWETTRIAAGSAAAIIGVFALIHALTGFYKRNGLTNELVKVTGWRALFFTPYFFVTGSLILSPSLAAAFGLMAIAPLLPAWGVAALSIPLFISTWRLGKKIHEKLNAPHKTAFAALSENEILSEAAAILKNHFKDMPVHRLGRLMIRFSEKPAPLPVSSIDGSLPMLSQTRPALDDAVLNEIKIVLGLPISNRNKAQRIAVLLIQGDDAASGGAEMNESHRQIRNEFDSSRQFDRPLLSQFVIDERQPERFAGEAAAAVEELKNAREEGRESFVVITAKTRKASKAFLKALSRERGETGVPEGFIVKVAAKNDYVKETGFMSLTAALVNGIDRRNDDLEFWRNALIVHHVIDTTELTMDPSPILDRFNFETAWDRDDFAEELTRESLIYALLNQLLVSLKAGDLGKASARRLRAALESA